MTILLIAAIILCIKKGNGFSQKLTAYLLTAFPISKWKLLWLYFGLYSIAYDINSPPI